MEFKKTLDKALQEMHNAQTGHENFCAAVYFDELCEDNAMVMFMELGKYAHMHEAMYDLYGRLSVLLGYPVCMSHDHPTDANVLVHGSKSDASLYDPETCCKETTINSCMHFLAIGKGYRPEIQAITLGAAAYANMTGKTTLEVLAALDWNYDPQSQLLNLLAAAEAACNC